MLERFKSLFSRQTKESRAWPAILSVSPRGPQWMTPNYQAFAQEGYIWNADVYACINKTVSAFRGVKFGVYKNQGDGRELITDGPLADLIRRPNSHHSWSSIAGEWAGSMELSGNAYIEGVSTNGKDSDILKVPPKELFILRPDRMFVVPGDNGQIPVAGYEYRAGAVVVPYKAQMWRDPQSGGFRPRLPVCHSKYWHPLNDWYGLSPIEAAAKNIDAFNSAVSWNVSLTQNTARPSGIFSSTETISATQAEEYSNLIRQKFSGAQGAGRPMILGMGLTWQQMGLSPTDMDWLNGLEWNTRKICAVFGIPPQLISDEAAKTFANYAEASRAVWMQKWLNMLDHFCEDLNTWLTPLYYEAYGDDTLTIGYDRDAIEAIQEDRQVKWANAVSGTGFLKVNEQRALLGYDPIPEGEVVVVPVGMVPLSISAKQKVMPQQIAAQAASDRATALQGQNQNQPTPKPTPGKKPKKKSDEVINHEFLEESVATARKTLAGLIESTKDENVSGD